MLSSSVLAPSQPFEIDRTSVSLSLVHYQHHYPIFKKLRYGEFKNLSRVMHEPRFKTSLEYPKAVSSSPPPSTLKNIFKTEWRILREWKAWSLDFNVFCDNYTKAIRNLLFFKCHWNETWKALLFIFYLVRMSKCLANLWHVSWRWPPLVTPVPASEPPPSFQLLCASVYLLCTPPAPL